MTPQREIKKKLKKQNKKKTKRKGRKRKCNSVDNDLRERKERIFQSLPYENFNSPFFSKILLKKSNIIYC